jgi:hypothetical protein
MFLSVLFWHVPVFAVLSFIFCLLPWPTEEQIIRIRTVPSDPEYLDHVEELAMDVANDCDRRLYVYDIALLHKQFLRLSAHRFDYWISQELLPVKSFDAFVQIYAGFTELSVSGYAQRTISNHVPGRPGIAQEWRGRGLIPQIEMAFRRQDGASGITQIAQPGLIILRANG